MGLELGWEAHLCLDRYAFDCKAADNEMGAREMTSLTMLDHENKPID